MFMWGGEQGRYFRKPRPIWAGKKRKLQQDVLCDQKRDEVEGSLGVTDKTQSFGAAHLLNDRSCDNAIVITRYRDCLQAAPEILIVLYHGFQETHP